MINYIFSAIFIYLIIGLCLFIIQRQMTFNKSDKPKKPENYGLINVKEIYISTPDNFKLLAWFYKSNQNNPIIIYFHGNSYNIGERAYRIQKYIDCGLNILILAWRGYSGNDGKPTEKNLYIDGLSAVNWVLKNTLYKKSDIILYGESLGSGIAVELGIKEKYKAIVLEAPFTSIIDIGKKRYPIFPVKYLTLDKFDNLSKIDKLLSPLLIIHGKKDEIVPYNHSLKLFNKAKNKKKHLCIDEAMHNNLYEFGIEKEIIEFNLKLWK